MVVDLTTDIINPQKSIVHIFICMVVSPQLTNEYPPVASLQYRIAGKFREVLIFVIFVVELVVTKFSTHEN